MIRRVEFSMETALPGATEMRVASRVGRPLSRKEDWEEDDGKVEIQGVGQACENGKMCSDLTQWEDNGEAGVVNTGPGIEPVGGSAACRPHTKDNKDTYSTSTYNGSGHQSSLIVCIEID